MICWVRLGLQLSVELLVVGGTSDAHPVVTLCSGTGAASAASTPPGIGLPVGRGRRVVASGTGGHLGVTVDFIAGVVPANGGRRCN